MFQNDGVNFWSISYRFCVPYDDVKFRRIFLKYKIRKAYKLDPKIHAHIQVNRLNTLNRRNFRRFISGSRIIFCAFSDRNLDWILTDLVIVPWKPQIFNFSCTICIYRVNFRVFVGKNLLYGVAQNSLAFHLNHPKNTKLIPENNII